MLDKSCLFITVKTLIKTSSQLDWHKHIKHNYWSSVALLFAQLYNNDQRFSFLADAQVSEILPGLKSVEKF